MVKPEEIEDGVRYLKASGIIINMKAPATKVPATASKPNAPKIIKFSVAIVVVLALITGVVIYRNHQNEVRAERAFQADKAKFAKFEEDVQLIKANVESKLGPGDTATLSKSCAYTSAKFERGTLSCGVYLKVIYADKNQDKILDIKEAALQTGRFNGKQPTESLARDTEKDKQRIKVFLYMGRSDHDFCTISQIDYGLAEYEIECGDVATKPVYPVRDNLY